jgi:hypothetical protein
MRRLPLVAALGALAVAVPRAALACGGCFIPPVQGSEHGTVVTAHRMILSISPEETTLWDQIRYDGSPKEFAWVLPVKPGARVEVASDALFDVLDAATSTLVNPPLLECQAAPSYLGCSVAPEAVSPLASSFGCAADAAGGSTEGVSGTPPVTVVSHGSAGPYEAVILHANEPDVLPKWLDAHGYVLPPEIAPLVDAYAAEGFDFAALRLIPSAGVSQMRPVRVVMPGAVPSLPLRMVAAGTGASTAITLFVVGEGRWTVKNFPEVSVPTSVLYWDYEAARSNYALLRDTMLGAKGGGVFMTTYAERGPIFGQVTNPATGGPLGYATTNRWVSTTIADAFVEQAWANGETSSTDCADAFDGLDEDVRRVTLPCDGGGTCSKVDPVSEIDGTHLECDPPLGSDLPLDDLARVLVGKHPRDVWVTRLEANLSRKALEVDLELEPASSQVAVSSSVTASIGVNIPSTCDLAKSSGPPPTAGSAPSKRGPFGGRALVAIGIAAAGLLLAARRRAHLLQGLVARKVKS